MSKQFRVPDLKAPRFRQEGTNILSDKNFFKEFKNKYKKHKSLEESVIKQIIKRFNEVLWETVIDTRDGVQLPEGLGHLFIGTCNTANNSNIDFGKSKKYGVAVSNKNWETDGKLAKIFYTNYASKYRFVFRECWSFTACRNFKRAVAKSYPENWTLYVQIDSSQKMKKTYTAIIVKEFKEIEQNAQLEFYNEFDL